jgi:rod shape-determining protein MreD
VTIYLALPLLLGVAILQTGLMPHLVVWGVFPDLPVLVVSSWALLRGRWQGMVWGFVAGVAVDLLSDAPFGAAALALMAVGWLSGLGRATVFRAHVALPLAAVFLATFVYDFVFLLTTWISGQGVDWLNSLFRIALPSALVNASLALPVFWIVRWIAHWSVEEGMEL